MTDQSAAEIINDLIRVNNDRICRYEEAGKVVTAMDAELKFLFARIIGESHHNKIFLATELQAMGEPIDLSGSGYGDVFNHYELQLPRSHGAGRELILQFSDLVEAAVMAACEFARGADDVAAYLKDIILQQQARCDHFRAEIRQLREKTT